MEKAINVMELLLDRPDAFKVIEESQRKLQDEQIGRAIFNEQAYFRFIKQLLITTPL